MTISFEKANELLRYDPLTGHLWWKIRASGRKMYRPAGCLCAFSGYTLIRIDKVLYRAHRLVWLIIYGVFPEKDLDHANGLRSDNRLENLRECNLEQNSQNSGRRSDTTSGVRGVCFDNTSGHYRAYLTAYGVRKLDELFPTFEDACAARKLAEKEHYGDFAPVR